jgi:hypothetical protein
MHHFQRFSRPLFLLLVTIVTATGCRNPLDWSY